jgi:hypothetical protein
MSFFRHEEIYPSDGDTVVLDRAPAHRLDEFPVGYSLAGCSPAEPASAWPTGSHSATEALCRTMILQRTAIEGGTACLSLGVHSTSIREAVS